MCHFYQITRLLQHKGGGGANITKVAQILWFGTIQSGSEGSIVGNVYKESIVYFLHCKYSSQYLESLYFRRSHWIYVAIYTMSLWPMLHGAQCTASQQPRQLPLYRWPMQLAAQLSGQWLHKRLFYDTMNRLCSGKIQCQWYLKYEKNLPFHRHIRTFQISLWKSSITFLSSLPDSIWFAWFTPKTPLWQCQHCKLPRHLDVNTHEAPVGENNRISNKSGWLF